MMKKEPISIPASVDRSIGGVFLCGGGREPRSGALSPFGDDDWNTTHQEEFLKSFITGPHLYDEVLIE